MGIFVDKARVLRKSKDTVRVEGGYKEQAAVPGPWFRCFFDSGDESEVRTVGGVRRRRNATVTTLRRDTTGQPISVLATDQVEVNSRRFGVFVMDVMGDPQRLPRGRVGLIVTLGKTNRSAPG